MLIVALKSKTVTYVIQPSKDYGMSEKLVKEIVSWEMGSITYTYTE